MGQSVQQSMSSYYHTDMRDVFVGLLFAIGFFLMLYKGFSRSEDIALNLAGALAMCIALFPTAAGCVPALELKDFLEAYPKLDVRELNMRLDRTFNPMLGTPVHGLAALAFFLAIGYVCAFSSTRSLYLVKKQSEAAYNAYLWAYRALGIAMPVLAATAALLTYLDPRSRFDCQNLTVYRVEFVAIWVFSAFWALKTYEIRTYRTDIKFPDRRSIPEVK